MASQGSGGGGGDIAVRSSLAAGLLLACALLPAPARAFRDCVDYGDYVHRSASVLLADSPQDVVCSGNLACVAARDSLYVLDVTDPAAPLILGRSSLPQGRALALEQDRAYVACTDSTLCVINLSNPQAPWTECVRSLPDAGESVALGSGLAVVACRVEGLTIFDLSDPGDPQVVDQVDSPHCALDLVLRDGYAYVANGANLWVLDLRDRTEAHAGAGRPDPYLHSIALGDEHAYLLDANFGIIVYDISDPLDPLYVDTVWGGGTGRMRVRDGLLFAGAEHGLEILDLSVPAAPKRLCGASCLDNGVAGIALGGEQAYCCVPGRGSLDVIDLRGLANPPRLGQADLFALAEALVARNGYAYVCCGPGGLYVLSLADPIHPEDLGQASGPNLAYAADFAGDYLCVASGSEGFHVLDLSQPDAPFVLAGILIPGSARWVSVTGSLACVADRDGLRVVDLSDPGAPYIAGGLETDGLAECVATEGDLAFVADQDRLLAVDLSDPADPRLLCAREAWARSVSARDGLVYVASTGGLQIFSAADPQNLVLLATHFLPGYPNQISLDGPMVYVACSWGGIELVDASDPQAPRIVGNALSPSYPLGVRVFADLLYAAESYSGISVYPLHCTATGIEEGLPGANSATGILSAAGSHPNPFNPATRISFTLAAPARVELKIFDATGRLVRRLASAPFDAGEHELGWDGRDERGRARGSGLYLARLRAGGETRAFKLLLLR